MPIGRLSRQRIVRMHRLGGGTLRYPPTMKPQRCLSSGALPWGWPTSRPTLKVRKFSGTRSSDKLTCRSRRIFHASLRRLTDRADMQADKSLLGPMTDLMAEFATRAKKTAKDAHASK